MAQKNICNRGDEIFPDNYFKIQVNNKIILLSYFQTSMNVIRIMEDAHKLATTNLAHSNVGVGLGINYIQMEKRAQVNKNVL